MSERTRVSSESGLNRSGTRGGPPEGGLASTPAIAPDSAVCKVTAPGAGSIAPPLTINTFVSVNGGGVLTVTRISAVPSPVRSPSRAAPSSRERPPKEESSMVSNSSRASGSPSRPSARSTRSGASLTAAPSRMKSERRSDRGTSANNAPRLAGSRINRSSGTPSPFRSSVPTRSKLSLSSGFVLFVSPVTSTMARSTPVSEAKSTSPGPRARI